MTSRIRVLAVSAIVLLGMTAQAQACFWPFCCGGGYGRACAWGGPVGYGRTVGYRRGFYAGYYSATSCCSPCSTCGTCGTCGGGGCSSCGVSTYYGPSYYGSGCCSTCGSSYCSGCSSCGTGGCANCSTNYYPDGSSSTSTDSTYSNSDDNPTDATTTNPRDDDFGPGNRSTDSSIESSTDEEEADSIPDDFQTPINPPGEPTNGDDDPTAEPLAIGPQLTWQVLPTRSRVHVEADIRAPRVARVEATPAAAPDLSILRVASFDE